jgi:hypothetical protein
MVLYRFLRACALREKLLKRSKNGIKFFFGFFFVVSARNEDYSGGVVEVRLLHNS